MKRNSCLPSRNILLGFLQGDNFYELRYYWIATAANAIRPLSDMLIMATDNLLESDVVWCVS